MVERVQVIPGKVHNDKRGWVTELVRKDIKFVQSNHSRSHLNVLRGMHYQAGMGKLVHCLNGIIHDVVVDLRPESPDFKKWQAFKLIDKYSDSLWIPPGFAHGFHVLTEQADVLYHMTTPYDPDKQLTLAWNDPSIGIRWETSYPILSEKDMKGLSLEEFLSAT